MLSTGGTIGMQTSAGSSNLPSEALDYKPLLDLLPSGTTADFSQYPLCAKDSSAVGPSDWQEIGKFVREHASKHTGFIISHGTDTMEYTAAALAYQFPAGAPVPMVLTGSCLTPDHPATDAWQNLADSYIAAQSDLGEPALVFAGKILRAARLVKKVNGKNDIFSTWPVRPLGQVKSGKLELASHCRKLGQVKDQPKPLNFSEKLLLLKAAPGLNAKTLTTLAQEKTWRAALICSLGNANLTPQLLDFCEQASQNKKHLVLLPADYVPATASSYPPLRQAQELGAHLATGYSQAALWVKLSLLVGQFESESLDYKEEGEGLKQALATNYAGELIE